MWVIQSEIGFVRYFWIPNTKDAYVVGDDGSLWSRYRKIGWNWVLSDDWTEKKLTHDSDGYFSANVVFNTGKRLQRMHLLVCEAVWGSCPVGEEVCHNDGDISNNNWWNLRYDTRKGNCADKVIHGTRQNGERNPNAGFVWDEIKEIRTKYSTGKYTQKSLSLEYKVSSSTMCYIVNNTIWVEEKAWWLRN